MVIQKEGDIEYVDKTDAEKGVEVPQMLTLLTKGKGGTGICRHWLTKEGPPHFRLT